MVHEDLGYETDCPLLLRVMPGISDQARNGLYPHGSLRGSRFGFLIFKRKKQRRRVRAWGERSKKIEARGSGRLVTRCFTTPSPLLLLLFFALSRTSPTSPCLRS